MDVLGFGADNPAQCNRGSPSAISSASSTSIPRYLTVLSSLVCPSTSVTRLLGDLDLHGPLRFLLHDDRAGSDVTALYDVVYVKPNQIAPAQLSIDGEVE